MNGNLWIDETSFKSMPPEQRDWAIIQTVQHCQADREKCDDRICALEKRRTRDTAASSVWGVIGGFVAIVIIWLVERFK